jgi:RNase P protein component
LVVRAKRGAYAAAFAELQADLLDGVRRAS